MELSPQARTILVILQSLSQGNSLSSLKSIRAHPLWAQQGWEDQAISETLTHLRQEELISRTSTGFTLTDGGLAQVKGLLNQGYDALLRAAEGSAASRKLCERVFGLDLCQFIAMSTAQLENLLEVLDLSEDDHLLDLGCGVGRIAAHIAERTGARVTGLDLAAGAIKRARERTATKEERVSFQVMDMDALDLLPNSYSAAISIDALHYASYLARILANLKECLREDGRMGFFYAANQWPGEPETNLEPDRTSLAEALHACGLAFRTWDFTQGERQVWEKVIETAEALRPEYQAEDTLFLCEATIADARPMLEAVKAGGDDGIFTTFGDPHLQIRGR